MPSSIPNPLSNTNTITLHTLPYTHPDASTLRAAQQLEIDPLRPRGLGIPASAANIPIFLVAYSDDSGEPVGCGGLRPLGSVGLEGEVEVKRMFVVEGWRGGASGRSKMGGAGGEGQGGGSVAVLILEALERIAMEEGWRVVRVETSLAMAQARKFYVKNGYVECGLFGAYEGADGIVCYEKRLGW